MPGRTKTGFSDREDHRDHNEAHRHRQHAEIADRTLSRKPRIAPGEALVLTHADVGAVERLHVDAGLVAVSGSCGVLRSLQSRLLGLCARRGAARDRVLGCAGNGGDQIVVGVFGREDAVVASEPQHDDAVGDGAHVLHVVAR